LRYTQLRSDISVSSIDTKPGKCKRSFPQKWKVVIWNFNEEISDFGTTKNMIWRLNYHRSKVFKKAKPIFRLRL
jgi:hypothetical protein